MTEDEILEAIMGEHGQFSEYRPVRKDGEPVLLGSGSFAHVYAVEDAQDASLTYALKIIGLEKHTVTSERFWETVRLQRQLEEQIPYVTRIIDACEIELAEGPSTNLNLQIILMERLCDVVARDKFHHALLSQEELGTEAGIWKLADQIGQVLCVAHENNILHRDVKLENIFWDPKNQCYKLGDFGLAKYAEGGSADTVIFTDGYGAPEIECRLHDSYGAAADVYSFGVTLYLLFNDMKFPASDGYYANPVQYHEQFVFPAPLHASEAVTRVLRKMCAYEMSERYATVREAMNDLSAACLADAAGGGESVYFGETSTITYREDRQNGGQGGRQEAAREKHLSREEIKRIKREDAADHARRGVVYCLLMSAAFALFFWKRQTNVSFVTDWKFWVLPVLLIFQAILLKMGEFYVTFGIATIAFSIFSMVTLHAVTPAHIVMLIAVVLGDPVIAAAGGIATLIWIILSYRGMAWADFFGKWNLGWFFLAMAIVVAIAYLSGESEEEDEEPVDEEGN